MSDPAESLIMIAMGVAIAEVSNAGIPGFPVSAHRSRVAFRGCSLRCYAINSLKRSMGQLDLYPFALTTNRTVEDLQGPCPLQRVFD